MTLSDQINAVLNQREHTEREEVDLDEACIFTRILIPLAEDPTFPGSGLKGDNLDERTA